MGPFYIASMHDYDIDFGIGILLKALLDFLNNKYFVLNFWSNKEAIFLPNKKKISRIKRFPLCIRGFTIQEIPVIKQTLNEYLFMIYVKYL